MRKTLLMSMVAVLGAAPMAHADVLAMPADPAVQVMRPSPSALKGMAMSEVRKEYGEPRVRHPARGGDTRKHPPITRWDYEGFSVFFERANVVDTVILGAPAPVVKAEELKPAQ
ncbi:MAG TPA: hypothetical protein VM074_08405 [Solimonas sp.]|nr:hypothetical protein [Solimonas sp.]